MGGLFGFWAAALLVLAVASLFVPKLCFVKTAHPRLVGFGMYLFGMFVAAGISAALFENGEKKATPQPAPAATVAKAPESPPPAPVKAPVRGIGLSYGEVAVALKEMGVVLERSDTPKGPRWLGQSGLILTEVTGQPENLDKIFFMHGVGKDDFASLGNAMMGMGQLMQLACPRWGARGEWLLEAMEKGGGQSRACGGNLVSYKVQMPLGISLTVSADGNE